ncbi:hypothetical protein Ahy_B07g086410 isoform C [Arachis hypogaea]|uniref:Uncharacterized protein n=1 Tax=Arachis hypogaea TaxID=3818 RepID=A0A444Y9K1_ARAHY|nr:hypothetical protein Ahy_B07g086410 isoform C [Arachis hypogaea]
MDTRMLCGPRQCRQYGAESHSRSRCHQSGGLLGMSILNYTVRYGQNHEAKAETSNAQLPPYLL